MFANANRSGGGGGGGGSDPQWPKFGPPVSPLQQESRQKGIVAPPSVHEIQKLEDFAKIALNAKSNTVFEGIVRADATKQPGDLDQATRLLSQLDERILKETAKAYAKDKVKRAGRETDVKFAQDFQAWLTGRSVYNQQHMQEVVIVEDSETKVAKEQIRDVPYQGTPWGNHPLTHLNEVKDYLGKQVDARMRAIQELTQLKMRGPATLDEAYIYYKYLVRNTPIDEQFLSYLAPFDWYKDPDGRTSYWSGIEDDRRQPITPYDVSSANPPLFKIGSVGPSIYPWSSYGRMPKGSPFSAPRYDIRISSSGQAEIVPEEAVDENLVDIIKAATESMTKEELMEEIRTAIPQIIGAGHQSVSQAVNGAAQGMFNAGSDITAKEITQILQETLNEVKQLSQMKPEVIVKLDENMIQNAVNAAVTKAMEEFVTNSSSPLIDISQLTDNLANIHAKVDGQAASAAQLQTLIESIETMVRNLPPGQTPASAQALAKLDVLTTGLQSAVSAAEKAAEQLKASSSPNDKQVQAQLNDISEFIKTNQRKDSDGDAGAAALLNTMTQCSQLFNELSVEYEKASTRNQAQAAASGGQASPVSSNQLLEALHEMRESSTEMKAFKGSQEALIRSALQGQKEQLGVMKSLYSEEIKLGQEVLQKMEKEMLDRTAELAGLRQLHRTTIEESNKAKEVGDEKYKELEDRFHTQEQQIEQLSNQLATSKEELLRQQARTAGNAAQATTKFTMEREASQKRITELEVELATTRTPQVMNSNPNEEMKKIRRQLQAMQNQLETTSKSLYQSMSLLNVNQKGIEHSLSELTQTQKAVTNAAAQQAAVAAAINQNADIEMAETMVYNPTPESLKRGAPTVAYQPTPESLKKGAVKAGKKNQPPRQKTPELPTETETTSKSSLKVTPTVVIRPEDLDDEEAPKRAKKAKDSEARKLAEKREYAKLAYAKTVVVSPESTATEPGLQKTATEPAVQVTGLDVARSGYSLRNMETMELEKSAAGVLASFEDIMRRNYSVFQEKLPALYSYTQYGVGATSELANYLNGLPLSEWQRSSNVDDFVTNFLQANNISPDENEEMKLRTITEIGNRLSTNVATQYMFSVMQNNISDEFQTESNEFIKLAMEAADFQAFVASNKPMTERFRTQMEEQMNIHRESFESMRAAAMSFMLLELGDASLNTTEKTMYQNMSRMFAEHNLKPFQNMNMKESFGHYMRNYNNLIGNDVSSIEGTPLGQYAKVFKSMGIVSTQEQTPARLYTHLRDGLSKPNSGYIKGETSIQVAWNQFNDEGLETMVQTIQNRMQERYIAQLTQFAVTNMTATLNKMPTMSFTDFKKQLSKMQNPGDGMPKLTHVQREALNRQIKVGDHVFRGSDLLLSVIPKPVIEHVKAASESPERWQQLAANGLMEQYAILARSISRSTPKSEEYIQKNFVEVNPALSKQYDSMRRAMSSSSSSLNTFAAIKSSILSDQVHRMGLYQAVNIQNRALATIQEISAEQRAAERERIKESYAKSRANSQLQGKQT